MALTAVGVVADAVVEIHEPRGAGKFHIGSTGPVPRRGCIRKISRYHYRYTANCHNLHFWTPTPTLPRWEREHKESADYARLQYKSPCGRGLGGGGDWDETTKNPLNIYAKELRNNSIDTECLVTSPTPRPPPAEGE